MSIDLNDPKTWGDDPMALADAAFAATREPEEIAAADDGAQGAAAEAAAPPETVTPAAAEDPAAQAAAAETPAPGAVPYPRFKEVNQRLHEERAAREALEAELAALKAGPPGRDPVGDPGGEPEPATGEAQEGAEDWTADRAALEAALAEAEEDGDRALALSLKAQIRLGDRLATSEQQDAWRQRQDEAASQAAMNAAWENAGLLRAWAEDAERPLWHQTALAVHQALMADPGSEYARGSWEARFAKLPELVEQQLGIASPHRQTQAAAQGGQRQAPPERVPLSISQIPGGESFEPPPRGLNDLQGLPVGEQERHLIALAEKGQLHEFLKDLPVGALNTRRAPR